MDLMPSTDLERGGKDRRGLRIGYAGLLPVLLVHLVLSGFSEDRPFLWGARIVIRVAAFVLTLYVSRVGRPLFLSMLLLVLFTAAAAVPARASAGGLQTALLATWSVVLLLAPITIFRRIRAEFRGEGVDLEVVLGALCAYLWIGGYFAFVYAASSAVFGFPFFAQPGAENQLNYLYFSFITLTTVGYGDLTPAYGPGRMLAATEAVIGQLYLVSVVAIVVSAFVKRKGSRP